MKHNHYDIAVIGGGLAGLSLAIQGATKGYKTVLFEKEDYPFHKVCGEYISLESKPFLEKLGLQLQYLKLPTIQKLSISDISGTRYNYALPLGGFGISRYSLDNALYNLALEKGVDVITSTKVTSAIFNDEQFEINAGAFNTTSSIVACCYGKKSNIDVKLGRPFLKQPPNRLNNYIGVKYHITHTNPEDTIALHNFKNGYCGISKIEEGKSCLCYLTTEENLKQNNNSIPEMERAVLFRNPLLKDIFTNAEFIWLKPLAISKVSFNKKDQVEDHLLMIGDSAGMITPLCGNGMSMALHASKLAFTAIDLYLRKKIDRVTMERLYVSEWKENFATRLFVGRTVQRMFGGDATTSLFLKAMNNMPVLSKLLIKSTHGDVF